MEVFEYCLQDSKIVTTDDLNVIKNKSELFEETNKFLSKTTRVSEPLKDGHSEEKLLRNANSAYPILHHSILELIKDFLKLKKKHGSNIEKSVYSNIRLDEFIDRLLLLRPKMFVGSLDKYILRGTDRVGTAEEEWHTVGTFREKEPLVMEQYLTYDEGKLCILNLTLFLKGIREVFISRGGGADSAR